MSAAYLKAKAEAHRLQAEQYAAEERAYLLNPYRGPRAEHVAHLRDMQASYRLMADELLAEISEEAEEPRYAPTAKGLAALSDDAFIDALLPRLALVPVREVL